MAFSKTARSRSPPVVESTLLHFSHVDFLPVVLVLYLYPGLGFGLGLGCFAQLNPASEVESPKYSLDEVKAITHPGFGGPGRERYSLAI